MGATAGSATVMDSRVAFTMLVGVFGGSAAWWLVLATAAGTLRGRLNRPLYAAINRVSGLVLAGFGLYTLAGLYG
jgi:threonine/homoserine/homoserine lactone efflux protein